MKKLLILILIGLLLALSIFIVINGVQFSSIEILGINGIQERNSELDDKIKEATKLASTDYRQAITTVQEDVKKLKSEKETYDSMTAVSTEGEIETASQIEKYEIEYLWTKLGNHATSEGAIMKMDVTTGSDTASGNYNLKFTVSGSYISITDFISDIENDSSLGFKIEEFKMLPSTDTSVLQATFVCKNIAIKDITQTTPENVENVNRNIANSVNTNSNTSNNINTNVTNSISSNTTNTNR